MLPILREMRFRRHSSNCSTTIEFSDEQPRVQMGNFNLTCRPQEDLSSKLKLRGFRPVEQLVTITGSHASEIIVKMSQLASRSENVAVTADVNETDVLSPDPGEKVFVTQDLLDANPVVPALPYQFPDTP